MNTTPTGGWRAFWMPFAAGWALFVFMAATNSRLATSASPLGILNHQSAGTAGRVDEIQAAWAQAGQLDFARLSMGIDLVFIGLLTLGALIGLVMVARRAPTQVLKIFAATAGLVWLVYAGTDYAETTAQFIQANSAGSDKLAGLAAAMGPTKTVSFLIGHIDLAIALLWLRSARAKAG